MAKKLSGGVWRRVNGANVYITRGGKVVAGAQTFKAYSKDDDGSSYVKDLVAFDKKMSQAAESVS